MIQLQTKNPYTSFVRRLVVTLETSISVSTISRPERLGYRRLKFVSQSSLGDVGVLVTIGLRSGLADDAAGAGSTRRFLGLGGATGGRCPVRCAVAAGAVGTVYPVEDLETMEAPDGPGPGPPVVSLMEDVPPV